MGCSLASLSPVPSVGILDPEGEETGMKSQQCFSAGLTAEKGGGAGVVSTEICAGGSVDGTSGVFVGLAGRREGYELCFSCLMSGVGCGCGCGAGAFMRESFVLNLNNIFNTKAFTLIIKV